MVGVSEDVVGLVLALVGSEGEGEVPCGTSEECACVGFVGEAGADDAVVDPGAGVVVAVVDVVDVDVVVVPASAAFVLDPAPAVVGACAAPVTLGDVGPPLFICFSISAFSSSVIIVVAMEVMSFMIEISPI